MSVSPHDHAFARVGLVLKAEKVRHRRDSVLLIRIDATEVRYIDAPGGRPDSVLLKQGKLAFLPVEVDCGKITLTVAGKVYRPNRLSPCTGVTRLASPQAMPLFVAFDYPVPAGGRLVVPVTVLEPDPPVQTRLRPEPSYAAPRVAKDLLGRRELTAGLLIQ